jgi:hypothetical protein
MGGGCGVVWLEPRDGEKLGVCLGRLVARIERLDDGRYRLTKVLRVAGRQSEMVRFVSGLRAVHRFKREIEEGARP